MSSELKGNDGDIYILAIVSVVDSVCGYSCVALRKENYSGWALVMEQRTSSDLSVSHRSITQRDHLCHSPKSIMP